MASQGMLVASEGTLPVRAHSRNLRSFLHRLAATLPRRSNVHDSAAQMAVSACSDAAGAGMIARLKPYASLPNGLVAHPSSKPCLQSNTDGQTPSVEWNISHLEPAAAGAPENDSRTSRPNAAT
eukprot:CAMPEP_0185486164 /NCGR_PEP_ID=MMETSP1366-20130426/10641_1 /TAXON_ID=38817 /ORGANISM="Gephyrocapsa oceanica, Strain RCC1303" /LENGTH=123 /DNA_ID=CAMNT_0028094385 /DNA_START=790 /DNA_END=1159 /DNA_ORIENTATION=+